VEEKIKNSLRRKKGRADPARSAHFPAEWRSEWAVKERRKNSLRRKNVKWADRAESALPDQLFEIPDEAEHRERAMEMTWSHLSWARRKPLLAFADGVVIVVAGGDNREVD
jgi:hypothetical protein